MRVMVVDDMEIVRVQVSRACRRIGFDEVISAQSGDEAWSLLQASEQIDAILSDYNMPGLTGEQFLRKVKSDPKFKDIPFVFVTSEAGETQIVNLLEQGIAGYITKPFSLESLETDLKSILKPYLSEVRP